MVSSSEFSLSPRRMRIQEDSLFKNHNQKFESDKEDKIYKSNMNSHTRVTLDTNFNESNLLILKKISV